MADLENRRQNNYRALRALYELTIERRTPGSMPQPLADEIADKSGLTKDETLEAMAYLVRDRYAKHEEFGPTYSITPAGEEEIEGIVEAEKNTARAVAADEPPLLEMDVRLVLALLEYAAKYAREGAPVLAPPVEGFTDEVVQYHLKNMQAEGLVDSVMMLSGKWKIQTLPWKGDRFRQAAKDETRLKKVLGQVGKVTGKLAPSALGPLISAVLSGS